MGEHDNDFEMYSEDSVNKGNDDVNTPHFVEAYADIRYHQQMPRECSQAKQTAETSYVSLCKRRSLLMANESIDLVK